MEQTPLIDSALKVVFDNKIEKRRHPEILRVIFASGDLEDAFAVAEAIPASTSMFHFGQSGRKELVCHVQASRSHKGHQQVETKQVSSPLSRTKVLGHLKRTIFTFTGHKRKYDELLAQTERQAKHRATAKPVNELFGREESQETGERLIWTLPQAPHQDNGLISFAQHVQVKGTVSKCCNEDVVLS